MKHRFTGCPIAHLLEVSLVEGANCHVVLQSHVGGLQLECTLKAVLCQLPATQKHIHHSSVHGNENRMQQFCGMLHREVEIYCLSTAQQHTMVFLGFAGMYVSCNDGTTFCHSLVDVIPDHSLPLCLLFLLPLLRGGGGGGGGGGGEGEERLGRGKVTQSEVESAHD